MKNFMGMGRELRPIEEAFQNGYEVYYVVRNGWLRIGLLLLQTITKCLERAKCLLGRTSLSECLEECEPMMSFNAHERLTKCVFLVRIHDTGSGKASEIATRI